MGKKVQLWSGVCSSCSAAQLGESFRQLLFTADSLADLENYDSRDWGSEALTRPYLSEIVSHMTALIVFMVQCNYVIQIIFEK